MIKVHSYETFATQDGPGIRLVIFLQGCMFRCMYCHNPDTIPLMGGKEYSAEDILDLAERQKEYFGMKGGITFSGGEPLLQAKELLPILKLLKGKGFNTCLDTNGYFLSDEVKECLKYTDYVLPDIKQMNPEKHLQLTGKENQPPIDFVKYLDAEKKNYWLRYVVVPGYTDGEEDVKKLGTFIQTLPNFQRVELLPYHNLGTSKWEEMGRPYPLKGLAACTREEVDAVKHILSEYTDKIFIRG